MSETKKEWKGTKGEAYVKVSNLDQDLYHLALQHPSIDEAVANAKLFTDALQTIQRDPSAWPSKMWEELKIITKLSADVHKNYWEIKEEKEQLLKQLEEKDKEIESLNGAIDNVKLRTKMKTDAEQLRLIAGSYEIAGWPLREDIKFFLSLADRLEKEQWVSVKEIDKDGLPDMKKLVNRVAFIFDGCVVSGWPLYPEHSHDPHIWEANEDVGKHGQFLVTHYLVFAKPIYELPSNP